MIRFLLWVRRETYGRLVERPIRQAIEQEQDRALLEKVVEQSKALGALVAEYKYLRRFQESVRER